MDDVDVLVVGAGLAGLHTATLLARRGHEMLLVERRASLAAAIRATGIFVRRTLDDFPLPAACLGPPIRRMVLYPPTLQRPVTLVSARDEFPRGLRRALQRFGTTAPGLAGVERPAEPEPRGGPIPVGGLLRRISCADGLLVGDAARAVSPLTAGGLDPCLRLSERAAAVLDDALRTPVGRAAAGRILSGDRSFPTP